VEHPQLGPLDEAACRRLLAAAPVGRIGFSSGALPVIFPVNFCLDGERILIASEDGSKVEAARRGDVACLEVDRFDPIEHEGWSVLVTGRMSVVRPEDSPERLRLRPWASSAPDHLIALAVELLDGRRIRHPRVRA
jgi:nitroimidazol reductase NimA-like FMN-containing flavoprotein (pyridoxamine 5'-phosphate oxidase superfamily)